MLKDFFISRDAVGFVSNYLKQSQGTTTALQQKLHRFSNKQRVSYSQWWQLLEEIDQSLGEPALGIRIGESLTAADCGVLGYLFRTSHNMAEALSCYQRFERLLYAGSQVEVEQRGDDTLSLSWDPSLGYSSLVSDAVLLAGLTNVARDILSNPAFAPIEVQFTHPIGDDLPHYLNFFACPVQHSQLALSIRFRIADLHHPIPHQDSALHRLLGKQAEEQLQHVPENDLFLTELHDAIARCLHEGNPHVSSVARALNVSSRTLHRRIESRGQVFRSLLRDVRKSLAERYLKDEKLSLAQAALLLGYQDQSAFTRAFKQWYGTTPREFRTRYKTVNQ